MRYEGLPQQQAKIDSRMTPLGLELTVNDNGRIFCVRKHQGNPVIVSALDGGPLSMEKVRPETARAIVKAFETIH